MILNDHQNVFKYSFAFYILINKSKKNNQKPLLKKEYNA